MNNIDLLRLMQAAQQPQSSNTESGLNYFDWLSITLVILKGLGYISCSWIWVFLPVTIPYIFTAIIALIGFCVTKFRKNQ